MRIALVHDYIKEYGGAERVLEALHEIWPEAPVYTSVYLPEFLGPHKERFKDWDIHTSFLQHLPFKEKLISPFRIIAPFMFKSFDLSKYDVVIVSATGAYSPNSKFKIQNSKLSKRPIHICYCHTPPRYLYGYATAREWKKNLIFRAIGEIGNHFLRLVDFKSSQNVDYFIANSKNVAGRIEKFYRREAIVIYPPVQIPNSKLQISNKSQNTKYKIQNTDYFLAGGRLARPKHIDLIVQACRELRVPLKVFGRGFGGYGEELNKELRSMNYGLRENKNHDSLFIIHNSDVEFLGEVSDEEKLELMRNAKAYIFASEDEDFGITPVEAMSCGTAVIAYRSGGVVESILQSRTGLFFEELTVESLKEAIKQFNNLTIDPNGCIKQAKKFSKERFKKAIRKFVYEKIWHARHS